MVTESTQRIFQNFKTALAEFQEATPLTKALKADQLVSLADLLSRSAKGHELLFENAAELEAAGLFEGTVWESPAKQVPTLVKGTVMSGHPNSTMEILSELRILAYALGQSKENNWNEADAQTFLEEVAVHNLEFAFDELTEEYRGKLTQQERRKVVNHFRFLLQKVQLPGLKEKLADEIAMVCAQRPIVTNSVRSLIQTIYQKMELDDRDPIDKRLQYFVNAVYFPGLLVERNPSYSRYAKVIGKAKVSTLQKEARTMGEYLEATGLTNPYLAMMLRYAVQDHKDLVPLVLKLNPEGVSEWERHTQYVRNLILETFSEQNFRGIYGLKRLLERSLISRRSVRAGLTNLKLVSIHPEVERRIFRSIVEYEHANEVSSKQVLMGALISLLGQPIGIGQGNNATCQSARGLSLWAQHAPAKLINMVTTVATANNLIMRFENQDLESIKLGKGLVDKLDHQLDAVSVILVPHLDKIYHRMMQLAAGRGEDPHKWANPAMYGQWISPGFASAYSYLTNTIQDYQQFIRIFYAAFHPEFNGGRKMVYPNPVGIFITSSKGDMLGFHALSLLRVARDPNSGLMRAYFLNPNNEGRQDWGQNIKPTVFGHGERYGESSLPILHFAARIYAFHYNHLNIENNLEKAPQAELEEVEHLAKESWGRNYKWNNLKREW